MNKAPKSTITSTKSMRAFLIQEMEKCANGEADLGASKAITNLAQQIYNTVNIELKVAVAKAKYGDTLEVKTVDFDG